ncbi:MAG: glycosyltransferase family 9 protein [Xanthomonadales bacterium]|nr:glycosyltransferase family 9 protein [Xanthomonadales bacterium]
MLRLSAIGDVTHALAVVRAIQDQQPGAEITWIIGKFEHRLVGDVPGVEFVVFDKSAGLSAYRDLRSTMAGRRFDLLLHMQVALRANLASLLVGADQRIGFDPARSRDLHGLFVNRRIAPAAEQHVLDGLMSFLDAAGMSSQAPRWDIPVGEEDLEFAATHVDPQRPTLVLSPVSSHALRNWRPERYAAAADYAAAQHGFQVILTGGPGRADREMAQAIQSAANRPMLDLVGKDTLKKLTALLAASDLVLAPDTGPMHMANAVGTAVIGLHAASNPRRSGPYHSLRWCVDRYDDAAKKFRGSPAAALPWGTKIERPGVMDLVTVEDVKGRLDEWVNASRGQPGPASGESQ